MLFDKNKKLVESTKMYGATPIKKIEMKSLKKAMAKCELEGEKSESCKKSMEELGIKFIEND